MFGHRVLNPTPLARYNHRTPPGVGSVHTYKQICMTTHDKHPPMLSFYVYLLCRRIPLGPGRVPLGSLSLAKLHRAAYGVSPLTGYHPLRKKGLRGCAPGAAETQSTAGQGR